MFQDICVYLIVAGAAIYLVRSLWLSSTGKKGCASGCGSCSNAKAAPRPNASPNLIQIDLNGGSRSSSKRPTADP